MKGEVKEPARHPLMPSPSVFEPGNLGKSVCNHDVFVTGWFVVLPPDAPPAVRWGPRMEYGMDYAQDREVIDVCPLWENPSEPLAGVLKDPLRRIRGHKVGKYVEATYGRHCCKLLEPLSDSHFVIIDCDTTKKDIEAICYEGGVKVSRCRRREIV